MRGSCSPSAHIWNPEGQATAHRSSAETFPENLGLRVHRGLSWLDRAEKEVEAGGLRRDYDAAFINLMMDHPESPWGAVHYPVAGL